MEKKYPYDGQRMLLVPNPAPGLWHWGSSRERAQAAPAKAISARKEQICTFRALLDLLPPQTWFIHPFQRGHPTGTCPGVAAPAGFGVRCLCKATSHSLPIPARGCTHFATPMPRSLRVLPALLLPAHTPQLHARMKTKCKYYCWQRLPAPPLRFRHL